MIYTMLLYLVFHDNDGDLEEMIQASSTGSFRTRLLLSNQSIKAGLYNCLACPSLGKAQDLSSS